MPVVESNFEYIPSDVEFCTRKLDTFQQALENDAAAIENNKQLLKHDAADARLSFKTIQSLRMPPQFQQTGLWGLGSTARNVGPTLHGDQEEQEGSMDLISYFAKQADEMDKSLDTFKRNLAEVETYLKGVESSTVQQLQRVQFSRGRDGGQRSADDQVRELAAVLKEFENGILGVAGKVGGVRDQVQSVMLGEGVNGGRRRGMY
jgi:nucleoporin p58/p45